MVLRIVLVVILLLLVARFLYLLVQRTMAVVRGGGSRAAGGGPGVPLVACSRCGVMVPRPRAVPHGADAWHCRACAGR